MCYPLRYQHSRDRVDARGPSSKESFTPMPASHVRRIALRASTGLSCCKAVRECSADSDVGSVHALHAFDEWEGVVRRTPQHRATGAASAISFSILSISWKMVFSAANRRSTAGEREAWSNATRSTRAAVCGRTISPAAAIARAAAEQSTA
jgi:hypothetical protein